MLNLRRIILITFLFNSLALIGHAQNVDPGQILSQWSKLSNHSPAIKNVKVTLVSKYDNPAHNSTHAETYLLAIQDDKYLLKKTTSTKRNTLVVGIQNDDYRAILAKQDKLAEWNIMIFQMRNEDPDPAINVTDIIALSTGSHINPFKSLSQLSADSNFKLGQSKTVDGDLVVDYHYDLLYNNINYPIYGSLTFNSNYLPVKISRVVKPGIVDEYVKTYSDNGDCKSIVVTTKDKDYVTIKNIEYSDAEIPQADTSEYYLSSYGHPEPLGVVIPKTHTSRTWLWFFVGGVSLVGIAFLVRRVSK